jgi:hypothetical protein
MSTTFVAVGGKSLYNVVDRQDSRSAGTVLGSRSTLKLTWVEVWLVSNEEKIAGFSVRSGGLKERLRW